MTRRFTAIDAVVCAVESSKYGVDFVELPVPADQPYSTGRPVRAWRNRHFLVALWHERSGARRLSINRAKVDPETGTWKDGLTWDELMLCKRAVGYGDHWCVEAYPPDAAVVDVAAIRHPFILDEAPAWAWLTRPQPES